MFVCGCTRFIAVVVERNNIYLTNINKYIFLIKLEWGRMFAFWEYCRCNKECRQSNSLYWYALNNILGCINHETKVTQDMNMVMHFGGGLKNGLHEHRSAILNNLKLDSSYTFFYQFLVFLEGQPHDLCDASICSTIWATETSFGHVFDILMVHLTNQNQVL